MCSSIKPDMFLKKKKKKIKPDILEVHLLFRFLDMATLLISCIDIANEQFERDSETCNEL